MSKLQSLIKPAIILIAIPSVPAFLFMIFFNLSGSTFPTQPDSQHSHAYHNRGATRYISEELFIIQHLAMRILFVGWPTMILLANLKRGLEQRDKERRVQKLLSSTH
jgi:hypothetical protein